MKKFTLFIALILTAVFGVKTTASAQTYETEEQIEWIKYAVDLTTAMSEKKTVFICVIGMVINTNSLLPVEHMAHKLSLRQEVLE